MFILEMQESILQQSFLNEIKQAKFIKLGPGGTWEKKCIDKGELRLGYYEAPHEFGLNNDFKAIRQIYSSPNTFAGTSSNHARQVLDFYNAGTETLWITAYDGYVWWCVAEQEVNFISSDYKNFPDGSRIKKATLPWSNKSFAGKKLLLNSLSGKLTKVFGYRGTICSVDNEGYEYLIRKLSDQVLPEVERANSAKNELLLEISNMITKLTWQDFELFTDLIFARSGWRRTGVIGKVQKTIDLEFVEPLTGDHALVQVKSQTNQNQLDEYEKRFEGHFAQRIFYVYHKGPLNMTASDPRMSLMGIKQLSDQAFKSGLTDWLIEKVS